MESQEITEIAVVVLAALAGGLVMLRLRQPAVVGYIVAGIVLGPSGLALVENSKDVSLLAELGVLMLLFLVGMELSLRAFKTVWRVSVITVLGQVSLAVGAALAVAWWRDWTDAQAVVLGFALAMSSTAVAIKVLDDIGELRSGVGQLAVGVLIAQDLAVVPMLLTVDVLGSAEGGFGWIDAARIVGSLAFLAGLIWWLSRRRRVPLPFMSRLESQSGLRTVAGLVYCFGAAGLAGLAGLSPAYGAFLAGLVIGNSHGRKPMLEVMHPVESVLTMVFFLSIGLLIDLDFIIDNAGVVAVLLGLVLIGKTALNIALLHLQGRAWPEAFLAGVVLAQVGEFSFLLAAAAGNQHLLDAYAGKMIVTLTALSLLVAPFWVVIGRRIAPYSFFRRLGPRDLARILYQGLPALLVQGGRARLRRLSFKPRKQEDAQPPS